MQGNAIFTTGHLKQPLRESKGQLDQAQSWVHLTAKPECFWYSRMVFRKRYFVKLFMSLKYITANVVDRSNGKLVATASTAEQALKSTLECGRCCNAKAAAVVGEVLARRLKVEGFEDGQGQGIYVDVKKEVEKKGFKNRTKVWAVVNALKDNGVKLILGDE